MSKYTTELRYLEEMKYDWGKNDYPIFDENYREVLNQKIIRHYYVREIGFETAGLFKLNFISLMNEIMPKYNVLYQAQNELLKNIENLYGNVDLKETLEREQVQSGNTQSNGSSNTVTNGKSLFQDTPQGSLDLTDLENQVYASNVNFDKATGNTASTDKVQSEGNATENYIKHIVGNNGRKYKIDVYKDIIDNIRNIDLMIIKELNVLFMGIY